MAVHVLDKAANGLPPVSQAFPSRPQFTHFMKPSRFEGEVSNLEIQGSIPNEINGTFFRVQPDPQFPPFIEDDPWFNGDGNVSAFRIENGKVHFKQRYVRTEKFVRERKAGRALLGKYRNKYTDAVEFKVRSTANTNIFYFNGKLLACKEDSPPYTMDPRTLETVGLEDFDGQLPCCTFTAHPKLCPDTGELVCMGYEAMGDGTPDVCYYTFDAKGKIIDTVWMVCPVLGMIHDFAVTKNWVLFPVIPQTCDLERMKAGGEHWQWSPDVPFYIGVLPRKGAKGTDVKWYRAPNSFPGHTCNAFEDEHGLLTFDLPLCPVNGFPWWPDKDGSAPKHTEIYSAMHRFVIDPQSKDLDITPTEVLLDQNCEFPRVDERYSTHRHRHAFVCLLDPHLDSDMGTIMARMGGGHPVYNALGHIDLHTKNLEKYFPGPTHLVQEPIFIERASDAEEGDGWLAMLVNNYATMLSELHIVDTRDLSRAQAVVLLPLKLRAGLHGNWVSGQELQRLD
ncbi:Lignostilbene-alpha,beta-dioxygenase isozyme I [Pseudocercospora fuligena]|uniref:Lignostilbene-alpha,beta-dioxygenase isozyme I n=1 Tax=Pseudocercospora fuligena TaxID=685502 RepID=A0A8H6VJW4_9PEZI|nr:Lignostilbene-alpha,beta-dioxygenase isozyme I [Pseudocercospora fuligena]